MPTPTGPRASGRGARRCCTSRGWSFLYGGFAVLCGVVALTSLNGEERVEKTTAERLPASIQLQWLALSAMGSVMLLAVTNHITQNISSVPFLWVLPLALYLITFVLVFDHPRWYVRPVFIALLIVALPALAYFLPSLPLPVAAPP